MTWLFVLGSFNYLFCRRAASRAPYVPTLTPLKVKAALELADLRPGQTLLELGCGDGKGVDCCRRADLQVVGYELNQSWR